MSTRFLSIKAVLNRICLSKTEMYKRIHAGTFPRSIPLGPQRVVFVESDVEAWMLAQVNARELEQDNRRERAKRAVASRRDRKVST
jgi:prophage regulatory protein